MKRFAQNALRTLTILLVLYQFIPQSSAVAVSIERSASATISEKTQTRFVYSPNAGPVINIWYGPTQNFGWQGLPQRQVNILGNVKDLETDVASLTYSLNGGLEKPLSLGPDTRRLLKKGDFAVEMFDFELDQGTNTVVLRARDTDGNLSTTIVTVNYDRSKVWPLPTTVQWNENQPILDQAQVIDGKWQPVSNGVRTLEVGYDRLIGIGDYSWKDYEVTVPVTVHSVDPSGYNPPSNHPGVGILLRWNGHTDDPIAGWQPKTGYFPLGAIAFYRYLKDVGERLQIYGNDYHILDEYTKGEVKLELNETYIFKTRVETVERDDGQRPHFQVKVWKEGSAEPSDWDLSADGLGGEPEYGSILLLAHHTDVTFGDVQVVPLNPQAGLSTIVSDDFNQCEMNTNLWEFVNPLEDASYGIESALTQDAHLKINVPGGSGHGFDTGSPLAPRMVQAANDTDFEVTARFESGVSQAHQMHGILFEQDQSNFLRFEIYGNGENTMIYVVDHYDGERTVHKDAYLGPLNLGPISIKIERTGPRWNGSYSLNGTDWTAFASFLTNIHVAKVGVYAANEGGSGSPAHTAKIDFFNNMASPIENEDEARNSLAVSISGNGSVIKDLERSNYQCGEAVTLTAMPYLGWSFSSWSGDLSSTTNPMTVTMSGAKATTAVFLRDGSDLKIFIPLIIKK